MIPEIETLRKKSLPDDIANAAARFLDNSDPSIPQSISAFPVPWDMRQAGETLMSSLPWNDHTRLLLRFFVHLADPKLSQGTHSHEFLCGAMHAMGSKDSKVHPVIATEAVEEIRNHHPALDRFLLDYLSWFYRHDWSLRAEPDAHAPFQNPVANLVYQTIAHSNAWDPETLCDHSDLLAVLAIHQPGITENWCRLSVNYKIYDVRNGWLKILSQSPAYDTLCLEYCAVKLDDAPHAAFPLLLHLHQLRGGHLDLLLDAAQRPKAAQGVDALELLLKHRNKDIIPIMVRAFAADKAWDHVSGIDQAPYQQLFELMIERWEQGGETLLMHFIASLNAYGFKGILSDQLQCLGPAQYPALRNAIHQFMSGLSASEQTDLWKTLSETHPVAFTGDFETLLTGKSKPQRETAASALAKVRGSSALPSAYDLLALKKSDARHGAALLIERIADPSSVPVLRAALETESTDSVRSALHQALKACGVSEETPAPTAVSPEDFDLVSFLARNSKGLKLPSCPWLDITSLPPLHSTTGTVLPEAALTFLIAKQSKHKEITAAPDILPLLAQIDRETSAPFALALVEGFLTSDQAASDRWALTLGGLLGDKRIIPLLLSRIHDWCENSRHKLAEYAAQAFSLLPGNEPLMVLDTLSNRYRSKFKNVGKACTDAFNAAATARGITTDELGDMVVPDFGFDAEGIRRFEWQGGGVGAELTPDFKLNWFDPETDKSWKSLPANAPEDIKTEVKTLTKLLREAVKGQTARLEMTLVRQRRWPVARWRELYENHPLLRSFASSLVWGVYDASGKLLRTFRRYPNGLLADAGGTLEELPEQDALIGMIHPLELLVPPKDGRDRSPQRSGECVANDSVHGVIGDHGMDTSSSSIHPDRPEVGPCQGLDAWRAHFSRFKIKQPFPQIDRPVEHMDPLHGNRRSIALTEGRKLSAGTFKARAEKRGWTRGSVVDAGGISSYYKLYPGAGIEVVLPTNNFWVGCDPMEEVELATAYFATAGSIERGSYIYNEPAPDDPRVLRFDQVPPVVFSETLADLKAVIATKDASENQQ